jgi:hypothetical protein
MNTKQQREMKTSMQELVEEMEQSPLMFAPALALIKEKNFLEMEKEQIMDAYDAGWSDGVHSIDLNDEYYNETFNTNEK